MAVIHISEAEAAKDLSSVLEKVRAQERVFIGTDSEWFQVIRVPGHEFARPKQPSEVLAKLQHDVSDTLLPESFGDAVEEGIRSHQHETLLDPWANS